MNVFSVIASATTVLSFALSMRMRGRSCSHTMCDSVHSVTCVLSGPGMRYVA